MKHLKGASEMSRDFGPIWPSLWGCMNGVELGVKLAVTASPWDRGVKAQVTLYLAVKIDRNQFHLLGV